MEYSIAYNQEDYDDDNYKITSNGCTFYWPKCMDINWLNSWLIPESFDPNNAHNYFSLYTPLPNDVLYDIGSSEGIFSYKCIEKGISKVYAFDPMESFIKSMGILFKNEPRVEMFKVGFSDVEGMGNFEKYKFNVTTIDKFIEENNLLPPTIIKMDIEGYELPSLIGASKTLNIYHPDLLLCKYHKPNDRDNFIGFLSSFGYKIKGETNGLLIYFSIK